MSNHLSDQLAVERFCDRHIGASPEDKQAMLKELGYDSLENLTSSAVPPNILDRTPFLLPEAASEYQALKELADVAKKNKVLRSLIGMGYSATITPSVIQRNILENPGWYTQYTPYQSEIAQGRLEALINFQTMIGDLTGLPIANSSLLDEATGAAEAMNMARNLKARDTKDIFLYSDLCHQQTKSVVKTRAKYLNIEAKEVKGDDWDFSFRPFALLVQYPATDGTIPDLSNLCTEAKRNNCLVIVATDLMALCLLESPGTLGADIAVGNSQRFGVPLGFGGPHAGFISTRPGFERKLPGRIVGVSKDKEGKTAYRLALATREQHIRRDKATSNICTSQVLLAIMAGMYAVYHGPRGLTAIASRIHTLTALLAGGLKKLDYNLKGQAFFDTLCVETGSDTQRLIDLGRKYGFNFRKHGLEEIVIALDEQSTPAEVEELLSIFGEKLKISDLGNDWKDFPCLPSRKTPFLEHEIFNSYHSETALMRYIKKLENRDLSLTHSMIPLGSCTMKLNASAELMPITWAEINQIHPFVPEEQHRGYSKIIADLESWLAQITGFDAVSLQPNSGAQGEYAGLLVIRRYLEEVGESQRDVCLIPTSAHGTNPASAALCGLKVISVKCNANGDISLEDLEEKASKYKQRLAALMVTYPSTHGVFESAITKICQIIHENGGQVYMDGANLQAQIGLCKAGQFGPDVCHLNLHKTFAIPHGGGGPGMGPIAVKNHLADFLPCHPLAPSFGKACGAVSAAPWGSASILPISWMYIRMMGFKGLREATEVAILNANYIAHRLKDHFPVVYTGLNNLVAHECIIDLKPIKKATGVDETDIAKRLMDYGFHAPTVSWPVALSMMIEPTESEPKEEIDRFCQAMIEIRNEIKNIEDGHWPRHDNPLKNAPHTAEALTKDWTSPYSRTVAVFPLPWVREKKFWPSVARIDNAFGDRNLVCSCPPLSAYEDESH